MSRIGKQPVVIPEGVSVSLQDGFVEIKGKDSTSRIMALPGIKIEIKSNEVAFAPLAQTKQIVSNWGTMRALVANAVKGVVEDFSKELLIEGVGFRAEVQGNDLVLNIGFSHQVRFPIPEEVRIIVEKNAIKVTGHDKQFVGQVAAKIRSLKKPEPYKGKGIMYKGEIIKRKAGKKAVSSK
ncbi:MAG: 50S ribosomal protein L6 [Candidatus Colwellbacteria bacterium]|nr:50S ribosomal protein L6 [Candidatus Colwellbacteria bacterium]MBI3273976.1 50S ribosomal protein L6 [Candidatus Colwellbacteria bacterium]